MALKGTGRKQHSDFPTEIGSCYNIQKEINTVVHVKYRPRYIQNALPVIDIRFLVCGQILCTVNMIGT